MKEYLKKEYSLTDEEFEKRYEDIFERLSERINISIIVYPDGKLLYVNYEDRDVIDYFVADNDISVYSSDYYRIDDVIQNNERSDYRIIAHIADDESYISVQTDEDASMNLYRK